MFYLAGVLGKSGLRWRGFPTVVCLHLPSSWLGRGHRSQAPGCFGHSVVGVMWFGLQTGRNHKLLSIIEIIRLLITTCYI